LQRKARFLARERQKGAKIPNRSEIINGFWNRLRKENKKNSPFRVVSGFFGFLQLFSEGAQAKPGTKTERAGQPGGKKSLPKVYRFLNPDLPLHSIFWTVKTQENNFRGEKNGKEKKRKDTWDDSWNRDCRGRAYVRPESAYRLRG
jgi:hypothetical protein